MTSLVLPEPWLFSTLKTIRSTPGASPWYCAPKRTGSGDEPGDVRAVSEVVVRRRHRAARVHIVVERRMWPSKSALGDPRVDDGHADAAAGWNRRIQRRDVRQAQGVAERVRQELRGLLREGGRGGGLAPAQSMKLAGGVGGGVGPRTDCVDVRV